jgi:hypothetical protein
VRQIVVLLTILTVITTAHCHGGHQLTCLKKIFFTNIYKKKVNMSLAEIKCEPVLYNPVDCNQPPSNKGHDAMAAMSIPVALAIGAMVSLLAMGLIEGVGSFCSICLFLLAVVF